MAAFGKLTALRVFARSFFVQAGWNFERMQNLGFFLMMRPGMEERYGAGTPEFRRARSRHLEYFNTHPYFSPLVAGAVAAEEAAGSDEEDIRILERSLMGALGSLGDRLFWALLRPLAALAALLTLLFGWTLAPLVLLVVYNVPHLALRWWGTVSGLSRGRQVAVSLDALSGRIAAVEAPLSHLAVGAAAVAAGALVCGSGTPLAAGAIMPFAALAAFGGFLYLLVRGVSQEKILLGATAIALAGGLLWRAAGW